MQVCKYASIWCPNIFNPNLTCPKLFQTERTRRLAHLPSFCELVHYAMILPFFPIMFERVQIIILMKQPIFPWSICSQGSIFWSDQLIISRCASFSSALKSLCCYVVSLDRLLLLVSPGHQLNYRYRADLPLFTDSLRLFAHISVNTAVSLISPFFRTTSIKRRIFQLLSN